MTDRDGRASGGGWGVDDRGEADSHSDGDGDDDEPFEDPPEGVAAIARYEARAVTGSLAVGFNTVASTVFVTGFAFVFARIYVDVVGLAVEELDGAPEDAFEGLDEGLRGPLELLAGPDPTPGDLQAVFESLGATGDVFGTVVLFSFVASFGPVFGMLAGAPGVALRRSDGRFRALLEAGNEPWEVTTGTFLGRSLGAAYPVLGTGIGVGAVAWTAVGPVGTTYLAAVVLAVLCVAVFVAAGVAVGATLPSGPTVAAGAVGTLAGFYLLAAPKLLAWRNFSPEGGAQQVYDVLFTPFGGSLPPTLQRFHPLNVLLDSSVLLSVPESVDSAVRVPYAALPVLLGGDLPPRAAAADLPVYLQHWFGYLAVPAWVVFFLAVATVGFRTDL